MRNIRLKFFISYLLVLGVVSNISGQSQNMPNIIPPSPKAENFTRFGNYPVNPSSGAPDISIPLYTIKCGKLNVPITLRYHIGNVKPGYDHSDVGVGWVLDVGGQISRTVCGKPDDAFPRPPVERSSSSLDDWNQNDLFYLRDCYESVYDTEYDIFNYSFPSESGSFIMSKDANGNYKAEVTPFKPINFNFAMADNSNSHSGKLLTSIEAIDSYGDTYTFGGDAATEVCSNTGSFYAYTSFMLKKITDVNKTDEISFTYQKAPRYTITNDLPDHFEITNYNFLNLFQPSNTYTDYRTIGNYYSKKVDFGCKTTNGPLSGFNYDELTLSQITFNSGKVVFDLTIDNKDITGFTVYDNQNNQVQRIAFNKSLYGSYNHTRLDSLNIYGNQLSQAQIYRFKYNPLIMNSNFGYRGTDYWGYYNGELESCTYRTYNFLDYGYTVPSQVSYTAGTAGNKDPNAYYGQAEVLTKMIYPTKGETEFLYEGNKYAPVGAPTLEQNAGGLRVMKIIDRDGSGNEVQKSYKYEDGTIKFSNEDESTYKRINYTAVKQSDYYYYIKEDRIYNNTIDASLGDNRVRYAKVTETQGDNNSNNNSGKTIYYYQYNNDEYDAYATGIGSNNATTYISNKLNWDSGLLYRKEILKRNDDGTFDKISQENNTYSCDYNYATKYNNLKIFHKVNFSGSSFYDQWITRNQSTDFSGQPAPNVVTLFDSRDYYITTCKIHLVKKEIIKYFKYQGITSSANTSINYFYDNPLHDEITRTETLTSKGDAVNEYMWYPQDYSSLLTNSLINQHILSVPIDKRIFVNGKLTSGKIIKYSNLNGLPVEAYYAENELGSPLTFNSTNPYSYGNLKEQFGYSSNRLSEFSIKDNIKTSYIWGYNKSYPVAKIVNASVQEVEALFSGALPDLGIGGLSAVQINTLRSGLPNAQVTTYTYKPLIGVTSITDPKGLTTYYEYDDFQRLKTIKDQNGNVIKQYDYHYKP